MFQDFTSAGWYTTGSAAAGVPRNRPVAGVTVKAFDAEGDLVGTAASAADGTYTLPVVGRVLGVTCAWSSRTGATGTSPPSRHRELRPPTTQGDNNTSVQLVTLDAGGSVTGVDFGLVIPDQVIQPDAPIATVIQYAGDPNYTGPDSTADRPTLVAQPWSKIGSAENPGHFAQRTELADFGQVGSAWGVSYNRVTNAMILAASLKRMSGFGDLGLGGLYRVPDVLLAIGSIRGGAAAENWFFAQGLPLNGGGTIDLGQSVLDAAPPRGLGSPQQPSLDRAGFLLAAHIGIGGVATTLDGETIFITNLNDRQVYGIDVSDPDDTTPPAWRVAPRSARTSSCGRSRSPQAGSTWATSTPADTRGVAAAAEINAYVGPFPWRTPRTPPALLPRRTGAPNSSPTSATSRAAT